MMALFQYCVLGLSGWFCTQPRKLFLSISEGFKGMRDEWMSLYR